MSPAPWRDHRWWLRRYRYPSHVFEVHTCDRGESIDRDASTGIDIGLHGTARRSELRELSCRIPADRPLARHCLSEIAEKWESAEWIVGQVGHSPDATPVQQKAPR